MKSSETITTILLVSKARQFRDLYQSRVYMFLCITLGEFNFGFVMKFGFLHIHRIPGVGALETTVQRRQM